MTSTATRKRRTYDGPSPEEQMALDLIALMESSTLPPWRREWSGAAGRHRNLLTGEPYRGSNPILLELGGLLRGSNLPLWCGGAQAKGQGWFPKKGSRCVRIVRPQLNQRGMTDENGQPQKGEDGQPLMTAWVSYKPVAVFNAADLVGHGDAEEAALQARIREAIGATTAPPETPERLAHAESVLCEWPVETVWRGATAGYDYRLDRILMPERTSFTDDDARLATWAHEQMHSTGHSSRLNRVFGRDKLGPDYAREELVAELGTVLACYRLGIGSNFDNHAAYLREWVEVLREEPRALLRILGQARKAADLVAPEATDAASGEA